MRTAPYFAAVGILPLLSLVAPGQAAPRPPHPIPQEAYDDWKSIANPILTNDGKWVVYTLTPQVGEGWLVARATSGATEYRQSRGYLARPSLQPSQRQAFTPAQPAVTADARWVVFTIEPPKDSVERARRAKKRPNQQPKASLGILDLTTGQVTKIAHVRSFKVPKDMGSVVAYALEPDSAASAPDSSRAMGAAGGGPASSDSSKRKENGIPLVVRDLASGEEVRIPDVTSYVLSDSGTSLAYVVSTKGGATDGVYLRALGGSPSTGRATTLLSGAGRYQSLAFDRAGRQLAFLTDRDEYPGDKARFSLYYATLGQSSGARPVVTRDSLHDGMIVAANGTIQFSKNGAALLFGVGPVPLDSLPPDSLSERAVFDLWHYQDPYIQPAQAKQGPLMRSPWYTSVYWPATQRWVRLGNDSSEDVRLSEDAHNGLAVSVYPYAIQGMWGDLRYDLFLVDATTGRWKVVKQKMTSTGGDSPSPTRLLQAADIQFSPGGKYVLMFEHRQWSAYQASSGKTVNLTAAIPGTHFENETDDHPAAANPWGIAGWTPDDDRVLVNDRYDVWELDPTGAHAPRNLTAGVGRAKHIVFRVTRVDREDPYLDPSKPLMLAATDDETKDSGFWSVQMGGREAPRKLVMEARMLGFVAKAKHADQLLVTRQSYTEFPDLWTGSDVGSLAKISDANPQQRQYSWGTNELVHFTSTRGVRLKGVLYKPENFDPKKKYPLLIYIYEKLSQDLHRYEAPQPNYANITPTTYVSKGYLVMEPDIVYTNGHPGESAVASVVPAVQSLIDSGFVDPKRVGLQGHSWGGYQAAYIVTRTNMFRAVSSGAPVANMSSAYGGIRWGAGINRSMQYEKTQSRIGATPWERPDLYLENSPLFHLPKVQTPLLIMHDDNDGAVPWYQGIELYIGLRRLGKEAYLFDYNGDDHGTTKRANGLDWDMRVQQFFDHYLLADAAPDWMRKGIPYARKGRDQSPAVLAGQAIP